MDSSWPLPGYCDWTTKRVRSGFSSLTLLLGHSELAAALLSPLQHPGWTWRFCCSWASASWEVLPGQQDRKPSVAQSCLLKSSPWSKKLRRYYLFACLNSLSVLCQSVPAGHEEMPGRKEVPLTAQSPALFHVQRIHSVWHWSDARPAWPEPPVPTAGWVVSVALLKQIGGPSLPEWVSQASGAAPGLQQRHQAVPAPTSASLRQENLDWPKNNLDSPKNKLDSPKNNLDWPKNNMD